MALSQSGLQENAHRNKKGIVVNLAKFDYIIINSFLIHKSVILNLAPNKPFTMLKKNTMVYTLGKLMSATTIIQKRTLSLHEIKIDPIYWYTLFKIADFKSKHL